MRSLLLVLSTASCVHSPPPTQAETRPEEDCRYLNAVQQRAAAALDKRSPLAVVDVAELEACEPASKLTRRVKHRIQSGAAILVDDNGSCAAKHAYAPGDARPPDTEARPWCGTGSCSLGFFVDAKHPERNQDDCDRASGGGILSFLACHAFVTGHSDLARMGVESQWPKQFSAAALDVIMDAAQDPDFYEWNTEAAHAQTRNDPATAVLVDVDQARSRFYDWERRHVALAETACGQNDPRLALYWLGYAFHGVEDAVFHEGISNAEHSYRDHHLQEGIDCRQELDRKVRQATAATAAFADHFRRRVGSCWGQMTSWRPGSGGRTAFSYVAKRWTIHKHGWDLDLRSYSHLSVVVDQAVIADPAFKDRVYLRPEQHWLHAGNEADLTALLDGIWAAP